MRRFILKISGGSSTNKTVQSCANFKSSGDASASPHLYVAPPLPHGSLILLLVFTLVALILFLFLIIISGSLIWLLFYFKGDKPELA
ncbi:transmembrane protein, putative [Medicago truncatula]|uniref:Transmembrane protein, putative n=1 Tax=Medicago truncatula TaxID=3880 RepID=A0A072TW14_MEDTR|nr:transmembrane protein, putative [Medicago truncatula]